MTPTRKGTPPPSRGPGRPVGTDSGRTREHLLRVARDVLAEEGFPRTTIREIAERAKVNPALLHYYFGSKAGLHTALVQEVAKQIQATLEATRGRDGTTGERLRSLVRAYMLALGSEPYVAQMLIHHLLLSDAGNTGEFLDQVGKPLADGITAVLREGIVRGEFRDFDLTLLGSSIVSNCLGFVLAGPLFGSGIDLSSRGVIESWADSVSDLILNGIRA